MDELESDDGIAKQREKRKRIRSEQRARRSSRSMAEDGQYSRRSGESTARRARDKRNHTIASISDEANDDKVK
jgi:hypothetical protein